MSNDGTAFAPLTGRLALGDVEMAYLELGEGPLALCLHGFPDTAWSWRHLMPALADAGYRAVAPFLRGYAPTTAPADQNGQVGAHVADIGALHDALGGGSDSVLIGHDWGAVIAFGCAVHAPDRWRRIVAASVPPGPVMAQAFMDYDQLRRSWYMFFFCNPLSDIVVPLNDRAFIQRLWQDWSPGYDGTADAARACEALADPTCAGHCARHLPLVVRRQRDESAVRRTPGGDRCDPRAARALPARHRRRLHRRRVRGNRRAAPRGGIRRRGRRERRTLPPARAPDRVNRLILDFLAS